MYASPIQALISALRKLPSVGQRTAERYVFHLLKLGKKDVAELSNALKQLVESIQSCQTCWDFSDQSPCPICSDKNRDSKTVCVVEGPQDVHTLERTGSYSGVYHVLRGTVRVGDDEHNATLKASELLARCRSGAVQEVILALDPSIEGETTMMMLQKQIQTDCPTIKVSRLARGLPVGADLQYADDVTLTNALQHRQLMK